MWSWRKLRNANFYVLEFLSLIFCVYLLNPKIQDQIARNNNTWMENVFPPRCFQGRIETVLPGCGCCQTLPWLPGSSAAESKCPWCPVHRYPYRLSWLAIYTERTGGETSCNYINGCWDCCPPRICVQVYFRFTCPAILVSRFKTIFGVFF